MLVLIRLFEEKDSAERKERFTNQEKFRKWTHLIVCFSSTWRDGKLNVQKHG